MHREIEGHIINDLSLRLLEKLKFQEECSPYCTKNSEVEALCKQDEQYRQVEKLKKRKFTNPSNIQSY